MRDPSTRVEWEEAARGAAGARLLHDCALYGLVTGGPVIDVERCDELLDRAAALGIRPSHDEATAAALALAGAR